MVLLHGWILRRKRHFNTNENPQPSQYTHETTHLVFSTMIVHEGSRFKILLTGFITICQSEIFFTKMSTDRSPIDPLKRKRTREIEEDNEKSPVIRPKQIKLSSEQKFAVNGSKAQREKNADFIKKLQSGETSCKKRKWDKAIYLSEIKRTKANEESLKIIEDDETEFEECFNPSNVLAGSVVTISWIGPWIDPLPFLTLKLRCYELSAVQNSLHFCIPRR